MEMHNHKKHTECSHRYTEITVKTDWHSHAFDDVAFDGMRYKYTEDVPDTYGVQTCIYCNKQRKLSIDDLLDVVNGEVSAWE